MTKPDGDIEPSVQPTLSDPCPRFAFVSHTLPPNASGQATVIGRLLRSIEPDRYCLISKENYQDGRTAEYEWRLPGRFYGLPDYKRPPKVPGLRQAIDVVNTVRSFITRVWNIRRTLRQERPQVVVACTGELNDIPAAYIASELEGIPFVPYYFDWYAHQYDAHPDPVKRRLIGMVARSLEPQILRRSAAVIVPNENLQTRLLRRYGLTSVVVHNPIGAVSKREEYPWPAVVGKIQIVYTGSVYAAQADAIRRLLSAVAMIRRVDVDVSVHLYTKQHRSVLEEQGIEGVVIHRPVPPDAIAGVQQKADILYLPLAFGTPYPDVIATSAPGKMGEYLASGRPILAHAPADSFIDSYLGQNDAGVVVASPDVVALRTAIERLVDDASLRATVVNNASRAAADFGIEAAQAAFIRALTNASRAATAPERLSKTPATGGK